MHRNVYIAHFAGQGPVSVILAPSREHAEVYWQGLGLQPSEVEEIDPSLPHMPPVISLAGIHNVRVSDLRDRRPGHGPDFLHVMVRGRGEEPR